MKDIKSILNQISPPVLHDDFLGSVTQGHSEVATILMQQVLKERGRYMGKVFSPACDENNANRTVESM